MATIKPSKSIAGALAASMAISAALLSGPAAAHHSFNAQYDADQPITLAGKVTKVEWENPHIYYYIAVTDEQGQETEWAVEGSAPNNLFRQGWRKDSLKPGDMIKVDGFRARNGANHINGRTTTLSDGTRLFSGTNNNDGSPRQ